MAHGASWASRCCWAGELMEGQFYLPDAAAGHHDLVVEGPQGSLSVSFEVQPGAGPQVTGPVQAKSALGVVVTNGKNGLKAFSSDPNLPVSEAGQPLGSIEPGGLDLSQLPAGDHTLTLGAGRDAKSVVVGVGAGPGLVAYLKRDVEAGTLVVIAGEDGATVYLNGREQSRKTRGGQLRIPFLSVRSYRVKVTKEGFEPSEEKTAQVLKGAETKVGFTLNPVVSGATLLARDLPAGTEVWVAGHKLGTAGADGSVRVGVEAGAHNIELRREGYETAQVRRQFPQGGAVELTAAEAGLKALQAKLTLMRSPSNAEVRIRREGDATFQVVRESELNLPAGTYTLVGSAADHQQKTETVSLNPGETKSVSLTLPSSATPTAKTVGLDAFQDISQWQRTAEWSTRRGGGFSIFGQSPMRGTVVFSATRRRGGELQWFVDYRDSGNYLLFDIGNKDFRVVQVRDGKRQELRKTRHNIKNTNYFTVSVEVTPDYVVQRFFENNQWQMLDSHEDKSRNLTEGRFGFYIPGNDEIGVRNFRFTPASK